MKTKICTECKRELPLDSDHFDHKCTTKDGFTARCKECVGRKFTDHLTHIPKDGYKFCKKCGRELPNTFQYFPGDKSCKNGLRNVCRECDSSYSGFLKDDYEAPSLWAKEESALLKTIYQDYTGEELHNNFFPNRSIRAIESHASILGCAGKSDETFERARKSQTNKVSTLFTGRHMSEETKNKLSNSRKKYYETHNSWWLGKKRSEKQCKQISQRLKESGQWKGDLNPRHINPLNGPNNGRWLGGITNFYFELRSDTKDWINESIKFCDYKCVISGGDFNEVHHTTPFRDIVNDSFEICELDKRQTVSDYTSEEFDALTNALQDLHNVYGYGACLNKDIHILFHNEYGRINFDAYNFLDFIHRIENGEFSDWFEHNKIEININHGYINYLENLLLKIA